MLKIKDIFKRNNNINLNKDYEVGDTVYMLAYPYETIHFGDNKREVYGLGQQLKIFKMKIIRIENWINDDKTRYYTDVKTGLEHEFGGYYGFDSWETIQKEINKFVDDDYKTNLAEKIEE